MSSNQRSGLPRIGYLIAALLCGLFLLALAGCGSARSISNADPPAGSYA